MGRQKIFFPDEKRFNDIKNELRISPTIFVRRTLKIRDRLKCDPA